MQFPLYRSKKFFWRNEDCLGEKAFLQNKIVAGLGVLEKKSKFRNIFLNETVKESLL